MLCDAVFRLADGRKLAYSEWGLSDGAAVFYCHGIPGSRFECWGGEFPYAAAGTRLVTADRPGIGRSDPKPGRSLLDWPHDVAELADRLALERFAVMGHSAGAAYALACAHVLRERVTRLALVGPVPRLDHPEQRAQMGTARYWTAAAHRAWLVHPAYAVTIRAMRHTPALGRALLLARAPAIDRSILGRPDVSRRFQATLLEAARQGVKGLVDDMTALTRPWGFRTEDVTVETLLWQGSDDHHVPSHVAEGYAAALPRCQATFLEGEGHFSVPEQHAGSIAALVSRA